MPYIYRLGGLGLVSLWLCVTGYSSTGSGPGDRPPYTSDNDRPGYQDGYQKGVQDGYQRCMQDAYVQKNTMIPNQNNQQMQNNKNTSDQSNSNCTIYINKNFDEQHEIYPVLDRCINNDVTVINPVVSIWTFSQDILVRILDVIYSHPRWYGTIILNIREFSTLTPTQTETLLSTICRRNYAGQNYYDGAIERAIGNSNQWTCSNFKGIDVRSEQPVKKVNKLTFEKRRLQNQGGVLLNNGGTQY